MNKYLLFLFFSLFIGYASPLQAQNSIQTLSALARQAKDNGENKKAIEYYEDLLKKTNAENYYRELLELYNIEKLYGESDKLTKKRLRKFSENGMLYIDRGYLFELQGNQKEADKYYNQALGKIDKSDRQTRSIAFQFNRYKLYNWVEATYSKARKLQRNDNLYRFELANALAQQGKTDLMVEELSLIHI